MEENGAGSGGVEVARSIWVVHKCSKLYYNEVVDVNDIVALRSVGLVRSWGPRTSEGDNGDLVTVRNDGQKLPFNCLSSMVVAPW